MSKIDKENSDQIDLTPILRLLGKNFWLISIAAIATAALVGGYARFVMDPFYRLTAIITPQEPSDVSGSLSRLVSSSPLSGFVNLGNGSDKVELYQGIMQGQSFIEAVAAEDDLYKDFGVQVINSEIDPLAKRRALVEAGSLIKKNLRLKTNENQMLSIEYTDIDPDRAFKVSQSVLAALQNFISENSTSRAKNTELFIKERLDEYTTNLATAEDEFIKTLKNRGVVNFGGQLQLSLRTASELRTRLIEKEMEIELYRGLINDSSELRRLENQKAQIQSQIQRLMEGSEQSQSGTSKAGKKQDLFTPLDRAGEIGAVVGAVQREYMTAMKIVELLRQQYELARIETKKEEPSFQIIDPPLYPLSPSGPNWKLYFLVTFLLAFFVFSVVVIISGYFKKGPRSFLRLVENPTAPTQKSGGV
jgi:uncharacterized protein involved in exopolysaccharide biosynthesis